MNVLVIRNQFSEHSTISDVMIDGEFFCFGLELPVRDGLPGSAIPLGSYDLTLRWSEHFQRILPHVENVPGRTAIEIHSGNWPSDVKGCLVVGEWKSTDFIGNSHVALDALMTKLRGSDGPNYITYTGEKIV